MNQNISMLETVFKATDFFITEDEFISIIMVAYAKWPESIKIIM